MVQQTCNRGRYKGGQSLSTGSKQTFPAYKLSHLKLQLANGQMAQLPKKKKSKIKQSERKNIKLQQQQQLPSRQEKAIKFCINDEINDSKAKQLWQIRRRMRAEARGERPLFLLGCSLRRWGLSALCLFVG